MRSFKRYLSAFLAVAMIFTMLMTLVVAEDSESDPQETNGTQNVVYSNEESDEISDADSNEASESDNTDGNEDGNLETDPDDEGSDSETDPDDEEGNPETDPDDEEGNPETDPDDEEGNPETDPDDEGSDPETDPDDEESNLEAEAGTDGETESDKPASNVIIKAEAVVVVLGDSGFNLLDDVTAEDEAGNKIPVSVRDSGGFDINTEGTYEIIYEAANPVSGDVITANRAVTVFAFDPQPSAMADVQAAIDAYEAAYQAALSEKGFLSALEVRKPRWQHEADGALMPSGWRCDFLVDETYGVTYWTFFPAPVAMTIASGSDLQTAIDAAVSPATIEIQSSFNFGGTTVSIPADKVITIKSAGNDNFILTQTNSQQRHFTVLGTLILENVTVDGSNINGGVYVDSTGTLTMNTGAAIQNCVAVVSSPVANHYYGYGGGVYVDGGTFTMNTGAMIQNCFAFASVSGSTPNSDYYYGYGGGVYVNSGTFTMNTGAVIQNCVAFEFSSNYSYGYGGGVYVNNGGTFNMKDGKISGNMGSKSHTGYGGGAHVESGGTFNMSGGEISGNTASKSNFGQGGGVCVYYGGTFNMSGGKISSNKGSTGSNSGIGGGVYMGSSSTGNAVFNMSGGEISGNTASTGSNGSGGGVEVRSDNTGITTFTMTDGIISGNTATTGYATSSNGYGGGVDVCSFQSSSAVFIMKNGEISGNKAYGSNANNGYGGGVSVEGDSTGTATFTMEGGKITGNTSTSYNDGYGGGVYVINLASGTNAKAAFNMSGGEISGNTATTSNGNGYGGGVYLANNESAADLVTFNMTGGTISGNTASTTSRGLGGGVYLSKVSSSMTSTANCKISGNIAGGNGGGVYIASASDTFTMDGGAISGNTSSAGNGGGVYVASTGKFTVTGQSNITGNSAPKGNGGGIYTASTDYSNLTIPAQTYFDKNTASVAYTNADSPPGKISPVHTSLSSSTNPLNNYDINWPPSGYSNSMEISSENVNITPPVKGGTRQSTVTTTTYITGTLAWSPDDAVFKDSTVYTATITLQINTGNAVFGSAFAPTVNGNPASNVTISSDGKTATFTYTFPPTAAKTVSSISVSTQPQLVYTSGDFLDLSALVVTVSYDGDVNTTDIPYASLTGAVYSINDTPVTSGKSSLISGTHNQRVITVSYGGKTAVTNALEIHTPPTVKTSVEDITSSSATIKYEMTSGGSNMSIKLEVLNGNVWETASTAAATSTYTKSGLTPDTIYKYRVLVTDIAVNRSYEFPISFKTLVDNPKGSNVSGTVKDDVNNLNLNGVVVTIERGIIVIASTKVTEHENGTYSFVLNNIPDGKYNLVSNNGNHKVTKKIEVAGNHIDDIEFDMTNFKTQSLLQIVGNNQLYVVVDGLQKLFENPSFYTAADEVFVKAGGEVEFVLRVEPKSANKIQSDVALIGQRLPYGKVIGEYLDFSVIKSKYNSNGNLQDRTVLTNLGDSYLEIDYYLPSNIIGRRGLTMYRVHNNSAEALSSNSNSSESAVFSGNMVTLNVRKFSTYAIAYNSETSGSSGGGSGGGGYSGSSVADVSTYWIEVSEAKTMAKDALAKKLDYARSSRATITGIRKNSLLTLAKSGLRYQHDTVPNNAVQVRVQIDDPSKATKDILVSGYVNGDSVDNIKAKFEKKYPNKIAVINMDQQSSFGMKVQIVAKVDLNGMNTRNLYFYSYDKNTNKFVRIETEYRIDGNGYLHFATMLGGYIIVSDGPLDGSYVVQSSQDLHNPNTGGDGPSETQIAGNLSPLTNVSDNLNTGVISPVDTRMITNTSLPLTLENYSHGNGGGQEIMLSSSISWDEFSELKRGDYINIKMIAVSAGLLLAGILLGMDIPRLRKFRRHNSR